MTSKRSLALLALAALALGVVIAVPGAAGATVQDGTNQTQSTNKTTPDAQGAEVIVEQPTYVDNDLVRQSEAGIPVYIVEGSPIRLYPQGFAAANVSDYGIRGSAGSIQYQDEVGRYQLSVEETGSYRVWWDVDERVIVEEGNETRVATETQRFEAVIRVDAQVDVTVRETGEFETVQQDAEKWRDLNATLTDMRTSDYIAHRVDRPDSNEALLQESLDAYKTTRSPLHLLSGGFTAIFILLFTTIGGITAFAVIKLPDLVALSRFRAEIRKRRGVEQLEGDVADKQEELDLQRRLQNAANWDWQDLPTVTDHEAAELRNGVAITPLEGLVDIMQRFDPNRLLADRVRAMDQAGYVAQDLDAVDQAADDVAADDEAGVRLARAADVLDDDQAIGERDDLHELADPSESLLNQISLDDPALQAFDPTAEDIQPTEFTNDRGTMSLPDLIDEFEVDDFAFRDDERLGEILVEFIQMVTNHPVVDDDGSFDETRLAAERLLQVMQFADDRGDLPLADWFVQHFETALETYDRDEELAQWLDEHRSGMDYHQTGD